MGPSSLVNSFKVALLAALLMVQGVAFFHSATHAFEAHKHAGTVCEVTQYCADAVFAGGPVAALAMLIALLIGALIVPVPALVTLVKRETVRLRAPPSLR